MKWTFKFMHNGYGIVDEAYKDGSASKHGICQTYKLALYVYALLELSNTYEYRGEENLLRVQGPDRGFHTGYDRAGNLRVDSTERGDNVHRHNSAQLHVDIQSLSYPCSSSLDCLRLYRVRRGHGRSRHHSARSGDEKKGA